MRLKSLFFRDSQETSVDVCECWEVMWASRYGQHSWETEPQIRVFPTEEGARQFKEALDAAFKLIKHTSGHNIELRKQKL